MFPWFSWTPSIPTRTLKKSFNDTSRSRSKSSHSTKAGKWVMAFESLQERPWMGFACSPIPFILEWNIIYQSWLKTAVFLENFYTYIVLQSYYLLSRYPRISRESLLPIANSFNTENMERWLLIFLLTLLSILPPTWLYGQVWHCIVLFLAGTLLVTVMFIRV